MEWGLLGMSRVTLDNEDTLPTGVDHTLKWRGHKWPPLPLEFAFKAAMIYRLFNEKGQKYFLPIKCD